MAEARRFYLFPVLLAAWPVVFLYGENAGEVRPAEAVAAVGLAAGAAAVLQLLLAIPLRDPRRAALVTAVVAVTVMVFGHVERVVGEPAWLLPTWLAAAAAVVLAVLRLRSGLPELTRVVAVLAATLVVLALLPALRSGTALAAGAPLDDVVAPERVPGWVGEGPPRDVYYLVFDRYGSSANLRQRFGWDNRPFEEALRERGFVVAPRSRANHLRTAQSLASSLNLRYLLDLRDRYGPDTPNLLPVYELLQDHLLGRVLQAQGYRYVHIGAWWDPTADNRLADVNLGYARESDFLATLTDASLLAALRRPPAQQSGEQRRYEAYQGTLDQLRRLRQAAAMDGPTFTFAHLLLPHQPFVFDEHGRYQSIADDKRRGHDRGYLEQLQFTNDAILDLVDDLLDVPADQRPIIVLQADEGPHPLRFLADEDGFDWTAATRAELVEKFAILNAFHLPDVAGVDEPVPPADASPVNTWRMILNAYFGTDLPLLPNRSYVFRDEAHVYDFADVTSRVR